MEFDKEDLIKILGIEIASDFISNYERWCLGFEATAAIWSKLEPYLSQLKAELIGYSNDAWEQVDPHIFIAHPAKITELLRTEKRFVEGDVEMILREEFPKLALIAPVPSFGCAHFYLTLGEQRDIVLCCSALETFVGIWLRWKAYRRKEIDLARRAYAALKPS